MPKLGVYFAHPHSTEGSVRESEIISELRQRGFDVINPFDGDLHNEISLIRRLRNGSFSMRDARRLVNNDLAALRSCDIVLVWLPEPSTGTLLELAYAKDQGKHIIIIAEGGMNGDMPHPWLFRYGDEVYSSGFNWIAGIEVTIAPIGTSDENEVPELPTDFRTNVGEIRRQDIANTASPF